MTKIDWYQVRIGGCPALLKALQTWEGQCQAEHCELVDMLAAMAQRVQVLEERLTAVEHVVSEELLVGLATPAAIAAEDHALMAHGHAAAGEPGDSWIADHWVVQYCRAADAPQRPLGME